MPPRERTFWQALGPGLLFAGAAVGVSHLVQSTRAGAEAGLGLAAFIILANVMKYPAFIAGPWYASATGKSLLEGYRRQGRPALILCAGLTLATMFTVQAAVTVVTAGLLKSVLGIDLNAADLSLALMLFCAGLLAIGRYPWLDAANRAAVVVLTLATLAATTLALWRIEWHAMPLWPERWEPKDLRFLAALIGWMPSAVDIAIWHSLWTLARADATRYRPTVRHARLDFDVGYLGTALLALCFMVLGATVLHGRGIAFSDQAAGFAAQVVQLYTSMLGDWSFWLIGVAAIAVMFSTTLTVTDGFPRAISGLVQRFREPEREGQPVGDRRAHLVALIVVIFGAWLILRFQSASLKGLVDLATTLSFVTAPLLALLNHRALCSTDLPPADRPGPAFRLYSKLCIAAMGAFALLYLWVEWFMN